MYNVWKYKGEEYPWTKMKVIVFRPLLQYLCFLLELQWDKFIGYLKLLKQLM
jgi:hypothetical protein